MYKRQHLVYILEAYKCGSVNKAARNCYISQSHLSTIIKNVEQEIGYPLFHRTANGITATPEGLIFMSHAEKIVTERNNIQKIPQDVYKRQGPTGPWWSCRRRSRPPDPGSRPFRWSGPGR